MARPPHSAIVAASIVAVQRHASPTTAPARSATIAPSMTTPWVIALPDAGALRLLERTLAGPRRRRRARRPTRCSRARGRTGTAPRTRPTIAGRSAHRPCSEIATGISDRQQRDADQQDRDEAADAVGDPAHAARDVHPDRGRVVREVVVRQPAEEQRHERHRHERDDLERNAGDQQRDGRQMPRRSGSRGCSRCSDGRGTST